MALQKITFDGSSVTSKRDADINHHLGGLVRAGIIEGLGNECQVSVSNNYITFRDGYVQIYGRRIYVEDGSQVYISLDSTKYGYVVVEVNLSNNSVALKAVETSSSSYPNLTQQDLSTTGTLYQFPITKYKKTTSSITLDTGFTPTFIKPGLREVKLVKKTKTLYMEDLVNWEDVNEVSFDLSDVPYDATITLSFCYHDTLGYGAPSQFCGSFVMPGSARYCYSYIPVRSTKNLGNTETVTFIVDGQSYGSLVVKKADTSVYYYPNCIEVSYYVLEY